MLKISRSGELKPGYKLTEVGVIPEEWEVKLLPDVIHFVSGKAHEQFIVEDGPFIVVNSKFVSTEGTVRKYSNVNSCPARQDDVLMVMSDLPNGRALAKCFHVEKDNLYAVNQRVCILRSRQHSSGYLFYRLNRNPYFLQFDDGVQQTHLLNNVFKSCPIIVPPLPEQRAIASALSDVDALLMKLDQVIAKKRDIKQGAMQELLTGKRRLPGFKGKWEETTFGKAFDFLRTASNSRAQLSDSGSVRYVHYGDIHTTYRTYLDCDSARLPFLPEENAKGYPLLKDGDLVIADASEDYAGVGVSVEITNVRSRSIVSGLHTLLLRERASTFASGFKGLIQYMPEVKNQLIEIATGISVYSISRGTLSNVFIPLPSVQEQTAIASVLSDMDAELAGLEAKREKVRQLKQGMMQELLTGRIRLV